MKTVQSILYNKRSVVNFNVDSLYLTVFTPCKHMRRGQPGERERQKKNNMYAEREKQVAE